MVTAFRHSAIATMWATTMAARLGSFHTHSAVMRSAPASTPRVKVSAAQTWLSASRSASRPSATRYQFRPRVRNSSTTPNRLGPSRPMMTTMARWNVVVVPVVAMPEKLGRTCSWWKLPPVTMAPRPWPNSCAQVDRNMTGMRTTGTCSRKKVSTTSTQNCSALRRGGRRLMLVVWAGLTRGL